MKYQCRDCDEFMVWDERDRCNFCLMALLRNGPNSPCGMPAVYVDPPLCYLCEREAEKEWDRVWSQECARHGVVQECQDCGEWILFDRRCPSCEITNGEHLDYLMDDRFTGLYRSLDELA